MTTVRGTQRRLSHVSPSSMVCSTARADFPAASAARGGARRTDALARLGALVALLAAWFAQRALLASLCSLPRFRSPRFTNSGTAHGRSASSKKGSSAAATVWTRSASTSEPVREAACRGIAKRRVRGDKRYKKHKETRTPPPPSPLPANAKNFDCMNTCCGDGATTRCAGLMMEPRKLSLIHI